MIEEYENKNHNCKGATFFSSWSGGKDSCLALHRAIRAGAAPKCLLTMLTEDGNRSRSHGLSTNVLRAQAASLGLPIIFKSTTWNDYEEKFIEAASEIKNTGADCGVFGDIDIEAHREWVERVCECAGMRASEPLWKSARRDLLEEFIGEDFVAKIVVIKKELLEIKYLGRKLDLELVGEFEKLGIDPSGENGEYHTVVTDGPIFKTPLAIEEKEITAIGGYLVLDIGLQSERHNT